MPKYRILTFDGGGIRGVYTAVLLERIRREKKTCPEQGSIRRHFPVRLIFPAAPCT
jgi:patatin-like phospholipase/acyl hydrolase